MASINDFIQLSYITATGAQYINTNIYMDFYTKLQVKFSGQSGVAIGFGNAIDSHCNLIGIVNNKLSINMSPNTNDKVYNCDIQQDKIYFVEGNSNGAWIDNKQVASWSGGFKGTYWYAIGARALYTSGYVSDYFKGNIYTASIISEIGDMLFNGIPVKRISDNAVGLFNTVNNTFYPSSTSTPFIAGPAISQSSSYMSIVPAPTQSSDIPDIYEELEYVNPCGGYIDSGVPYYYTKCMEVKISVQVSGTSTKFDAIGIKGNSSAPYVIRATNGRIRFIMYETTVEKWISDNTPYVAKVSRNGAYVNGEKVGDIPRVETSATGESYYIGASRGYSSTTPWNLFYGKLYSARIYDKDNESTMYFDGVPVRRKSDGAVGLYDKVTKTLFTSKSDKSFLAGPTKPPKYINSYITAIKYSDYDMLEYIKFTGDQYINTKISMDALVLSATFSADVITENRSVMGAGYSWAQLDHEININTSNINFSYGSNTASYNSISAGTKYIATVSRSGAWVNGTQIASSWSTSYMQLYYYIGATNIYNSVGKYFKGNIYSVSIGSFNGQPARRISDGAVGLLNTNNGQFYTSATATPIVAGPVVIPAIGNSCKTSIVYES